MGTARLFDALPDFGAMSHVASVMHASAPTAPMDDAISEYEVAERVRQEVEQAEQALEQRLSERHETEMANALAEERERAQAELEARTKELGEQAGQAIAARLAEMEETLAGHVTATVARIVGGVLTDELQRRSIESLAVSLRQALRDDEAIRLEVRGPQYLFEALASALPDRTDSLHYVEGDGFDLSVTLDGMLFETRLGEWSTALAEILK